MGTGADSGISSLEPKFAVIRRAFGLLKLRVSDFGVRGIGLRIWGLGFGIWGLGFKGSGFWL